MAQVAFRPQVLAHPAVLLEIADPGDEVEVDDVAAGQDVDGIDARGAPFARGQPVVDALAVLAPVDVGIGEQPIGQAFGLHGCVRERERVAQIGGVLGQSRDDDGPGHRRPESSRRERGHPGRRDHVGQGQGHQHVAISHLHSEQHREVHEDKGEVRGQQPQERMASKLGMPRRAREAPDLGREQKHRRLQCP